MHRFVSYKSTTIFSTNMRYWNGYFWLPQNGCYCNENSLYKAKAKAIQYRNYKRFHEQSFILELNNELLKININNAELKEFNEIFLKVLDKHAPRKQKYIRANNANYITKARRKKIMQRSRLCKKILRQRTKESKIAYNKQRNIWVRERTLSMSEGGGLGLGGGCSPGDHRPKYFMA